jgi:regulator of sigma E protease
MILTILLGLIGLGLMVFVHELGHFVAAKLNGVAVEVFSLGWGPRMIGFTRGGTTYQVSWFPIGGYCKMRGELVPGIAGGGGAAAAGAAVEVPSVPQEKKGDGSFLTAAPWRRIVIAAFGPLFNLLFALAIFTMIWWIGFVIYSSDNRVVLATDYTLDSFVKTPPASLAGLKTGDRVIAIDGAPVEKFQDILEKVSVAPGRKFAFTVTRMVNGSAQTVSLSMAPELDKNTGAGRIGIYSWVDPVVDTVEQGSAGAIAGLRKGDRIVSANDRKISNTMDLYQELAGKPQKIALTYERAGATEQVPLVLMYDEKGAPNLGIGFAALTYRSPHMGFGAAVRQSVDETWSTAVLTVKGIGLLFQGIKVRNAVAGPLRITYYIGTAATSGFHLGFAVGVVSFFRFLAFLSCVLFLMNLLPIPAMDGGQIILFIVEIIRGKPVRSRLIWRIQLIGFSLLILISVFVTFSDILFFMGR